MKNAVLLSVGINEYDRFQTLGLCVKDAENITNSFKSRYPEIVVEELHKKNPDITHDQILGELSEISQHSFGNDDVVIFFYAGHGFSLEGKDYITAKDTNIDDLSTAVSTDTVIDCLKKTKAGNAVLIIDACRSDIDRGASNFGERTAELSRRCGVVTYFSCSPGETSKELSVLNGGIFSYTFSKLLKTDGLPFTPFMFNRNLIDDVSELCRHHKLGKQTPYTAVAPLEKAIFDIFTGLRHDVNPQKKEMVLVLGPSNAGKTTIGQYLAREHGYIHAEMSTYAWKRFNECDGFRGSILDFMEKEVWRNGHEDAIAQDLINSNVGEGKIVVCGPRRVEEIETLLSQGWDVKLVFVFANAGLRYARIQHSSGRYGPSYEEFIRKDLKEFSWGIAHMAQIKNVELVINEENIEECFQSIVSSLNN